MFDTGVLSFRVLTDQDSVDVVVGRLVSFDGHAWTYICKEVECPTQRQVQRNVSLSNFGFDELTMFILGVKCD